MTVTAYNPDHAHYILTVLADCEYSSAFSLGELPLADITEEEAITHFGWLLDLGYVEGNPDTVANRVAPLDYYGLRLTGLGVAFLETFHNQGFYAKTKQKAKEIGCGQMPNVLLKIGERLVENIPI
jgi:hypothetical protein